VSDIPVPAAVEVEHLRLADARALLEHGGASPLPDLLGSSPTAYLQGLIDGLCELSLRDPLTGLFNRRHFVSVLQREIDVAARTGEPALLLMIDIDHFKRINDTHGHLVGDLVLQAVAKCLAHCIRPMDTLARYGGEEFAIVIPNCVPKVGQAVAERVLRAVEAMEIPVGLGAPMRATISVGGAYAPEWVRSTTALWIDRADNQLYRAKHEGRNRVSIGHQQVISVSPEEKTMLFGHLSEGEPAWVESVISELPDGSAQEAPR